MRRLLEIHNPRQGVPTEADLVTVKGAQVGHRSKDAMPASPCFYSIAFNVARRSREISARLGDDGGIIAPLQNCISPDEKHICQSML